MVIEETKNSEQSVVETKKSEQSIVITEKSEQGTVGTENSEQGAGESNKSVQGKAIVNKFALGSVAAALIPIPLVNGAVVAGVQLDMLRRLAKLYDVKFSEDVGKAAIAALISGGSAGALRTLTKNITGILGFVAILGVGAVGSGTTYAVGNVFIQHFESGGTLLTFDPEKVRDYYAKLLDKAPSELQKKSKYVGVKP